MARSTLILLMGVSGSGKTTVGQRLARELGWPFYDGDDLHPPENVRKMASGQPLDDDDRRPWLRRVRVLIDAQLDEGRSAVVTCSALKRVYRDVLRDGAPGVALVYLAGSYELIAERLRRRQGHFMPPELLRSQFNAFEEPGDEALRVDVSAPVEDVVRAIRTHLSL